MCIRLCVLSIAGGLARVFIRGQLSSVYVGAVICSAFNPGWSMHRTLLLLWMCAAAEPFFRSAGRVSSPSGLNGAYSFACKDASVPHCVSLSWPVERCPVLRQILLRVVHFRGGRRFVIACAQVARCMFCYGLACSGFDGCVMQVAGGRHYCGGGWCYY
jgi:hypothetical protein